MHEHQQKFIQQANELMSELEHSLLMFEKNKEDLSITDGIQRIMHTVKGSAGMFGYKRIIELSHKIETIYEQIQKGETQANEQVINTSFKAADMINKLLDADNNPDIKLRKSYDFLIEEIQEIIGEEAQAAEEKNRPQDANFFYIRFMPDEDIEERGINLRSIFNKLGDLGEMKLNPKPNNEEGKFSMQWEIYLATETEQEEIEDLLMFIDMEIEMFLISDKNLLVDESFVEKIEEHSGNSELLEGNFIQEIADKILKAREAEKEDAKPEMKQTTKSTLRVDAEKLDDLMRNVSELITLKSEISLISVNSKDMQLIELAEKLDKISAGIRNDVFEIRLISLESIRVNIERLIRDTAIALKKEVQFTSEGLQTELDKTIVEKLSTPLMHIIRNSIDHGIEPAIVRAERDKPAHGNINVRAWQSGSYANISIMDDGGGIDKEKIINKAIDKKIIKDADNLSEKEIYDLMFAPGLTTAPELSEVSGRGVGMDVVKNEILSMRGDIIVESEAGTGTTVTLRLPVSLSIIDTLLLKSGHMHFCIPIEEIVMVELTNKQKLDSVDNKYIKIQSELIPYISLREAFNTHIERPTTEVAVVISKEGRKGAIIADKVIGEYQAVIKPLGDAFQTKDFLLGGSVMADGNISYIVDTAKLIETYKQDS